MIISAQINFDLKIHSSWLRHFILLMLPRVTNRLVTLNVTLTFLS
jgi:hypothetical protein